jgi:8-oxo-dGTP diphosphatase
MTPIAIAVVEHEGRFLIGQRPAGVPLAGLWEFPGGKVEAGESPEEAAVRECREETDLIVLPLFRYLEHIQNYDHGQVKLYFIACRLADSQPTTTRRSFFLWVPRDELSAFSFPSGNAGLLQILAQEKNAAGPLADPSILPPKQ